MRTQLLLEQYKVYWMLESEQACVGHVHHVHLNDHGGSLEIPVGFFCTYFKQGEDYRRAHWAVELFLSSDVRFDAEKRTTTYVGRFASNELQRIGKKSKLPYHDARLPKSLAQIILSETSCTEPLLMQIYEGVNSSFIEMGETFIDD
jgi:hypothetical protein